MLKSFTFLPAFAVAVSMSLPAIAEEAPSANTVMATVNGVEITLGHMLVAKATLPEQYQQLPNEVLFEGILDQLVQQTALQQSFDGDLPARVGLSLDNEERSLIAGEAVEAILETAVTAESLQAAYEERYANAEATQEYNASHILVETEEEAQTIVADLEAGADFAATAREKSTGPSGPGGGSLGWFGTGAMVPDFEAAVIALEVGAVSAPVQTQFGWHVIKLNETRKQEVPQLDDVRADLEQEVRRAAVDAAVEQLTANADVDRSASEGVDPAVLEQLDLID